MKVLFLTSGTEVVASSRTRGYQYLPYLRTAGIQCYIVPVGAKITNVGVHRIWKFIKRRIRHTAIALKVIVLSVWCNIVFIQKCLLPICFQNLIRLLNKHIIFDFDDALYALPQDRMNSKVKTVTKRLAHIIRISKSVIVANDFTKQYALQFNKNISIITGPIDCKKYFPSEKCERRNLVIGWIGSSATTAYLALVLNVLKKIKKNYPDITIELIGASKVLIEDANVRIKKWALDTEVTYLQNFDIGIMPLPDNEWTRGKGGYKLLQYMAVGIPCVASPVGVNAKLIREGINGYLANSENEWYKKLEVLIKNETLRESMGKNGRKIAETQYSFEVSVPKLIKLIKEVGSRGKYDYENKVYTATS